MKVLKFFFSKAFFVGLSISVQVAVLFIMILKLEEYFVYFYAVSFVISLLVVLVIVNSSSNPAYKIAWIIPILLFPIFGGLFYITIGGNRLSKRAKKELYYITEKTKYYLGNSDVFTRKIANQNASADRQSGYIQNTTFYPAYEGTYTKYLPLGEEKFEKLLETLKRAEKFIFLEYFIITRGVMWDSILEILKEKAKQGVDVRIIFDDMGCLFLLPKNYDKALETCGIKCCIFNRFRPVLSSALNNRDHRKIVVVDGYMGFLGGINIGDEYINTYEKHGHWKDTAVFLKGDAVWSMTVMFLAMWGCVAGTDEDFEKFKPDFFEFEKDEICTGVVQPYSDNPMDMEDVGETVYMNMINQAEKYVYINTPYLIIDNEMTTALCVAAKSGIDVRIVTPYIPDKWYVHLLTRAHYEKLIESGVKIYEYTPGFIHAKSFVSDDKFAVVGSINLDYRSLYLHFESAVWLHNTQSIKDIKNDYLDTLKKCQKITLAECKNTKLYMKILRAVIKVFAPLF